MDMLFALIRTEALDELGQHELKQLKNRYSDPASEPTIQLGFDRQKMTVYDLDSKANINNPMNYASSVPKAVVPPMDNDDDVPWGSDGISVVPKNDFSNFTF